MTRYVCRCILVVRIPVEAVDADWLDDSFFKQLALLFNLTMLRVFWARFQVTVMRTSTSMPKSSSSS